MKVWFIGAGPGDPELITVKGKALIERCPVCLYAGSLIPHSLLSDLPSGKRIVDTAPLNLDQIEAEYILAADHNQDVARLHSGDPSIYGAIGEQIRLLDTLNIEWEIVPGVPAFAAAAASLGRELTLPNISQTLILTRTSMKSSPMPDGESLRNLGRSGATLVIHLSVRNLRTIERELIPLYGEDCPVAVVYRVGWQDEQIIRGTLADIRALVRNAKITRTALIIVGRVLSGADFTNSALYSPKHRHILRPGISAHNSGSPDTKSNKSPD